MKNKLLDNLFSLIAAFSIIILFNSCALSKKINAAGYTLWHHHKKTSKEKEFVKAGIKLTDETEIVQSFNILADQESNKLEIPELSKKNDHFVKHPQPKKTKSTFSISKKQKENHAPAKQYKLSVSQVNGLAFVSFLLIPVMVLGFFIPGAAGIAIILSALIIGVLLAAFTLAIGYERRGVWMAGIAAGFWLVILVYLTLILFIF